MVYRLSPDCTRYCVCGSIGASTFVDDVCAASPLTSACDRAAGAGATVAAAGLASGAGGITIFMPGRSLVGSMPGFARMIAAYRFGLPYWLSEIVENVSPATTT